MAFLATQALKYAKDELIDSAKEQLLEQLEDKLKQGDAGINALFADLTKKLKSLAVLQTILVPICKLKQEDALKLDLKEKIDKIDFSTELEKMPGITDDMKLKINSLREDLKLKLKELIDALITCDNVSANGNPAPAPANGNPAPATIGGYKQRDRKQKRRQKTKKRIYKKSRGRRQYSRK